MLLGFPLGPMIYLVTGSCPLRLCQVWVPSHEADLKRNQK